jgi:nicotinate-nucleotide--dimethylbenzimidazole phosphoribosyltransferase
MAGDHGVTAEGVSAFPQKVTTQMMYNFVSGGAAVSVLARHAGAQISLVDVGVAGDLSKLAASGSILSARIAAGTQNIAKGPAMTTEQALRALEVGIEVARDLSKLTDVFAAGEMGIGNTTPSSAIVAALCAIDAAAATGRGTGLDNEMLGIKTEVVRCALKLNQPDPNDALDVLTKVGGFEIGAIAGLILGASAQHKIVLVDGFVSTAGALLAQLLCPATADYMIAAHLSPEPGHAAALRRLAKQPLLDLDLRLGEGTGAVLAMHLLEASVRILTEMNTFEGAGISRGDV